MDNNKKNRTDAIDLSKLLLSTPLT